jgi:hypothetical protein
MVHFVLAFLLMLAVLAVFVSPAGNLQKTALRAQQAAVMVLLSIAIAAQRSTMGGVTTGLHRPSPDVTAHDCSFSRLFVLLSVLLC